MNITTDILLAIIEPWQAALYQALTGRLTLNHANGMIEHLDRHRLALHARGDEAALIGIATPIRLSMIKLASVDARSKHLLQRKMKILIAHRASWADHPMTVAVIEAAVLSDATALGLGPIEEQQLLRRLRGAL